jgi:hypothetical protein
LCPSFPGQRAAFSSVRKISRLFLPFSAFAIHRHGAHGDGLFVAVTGIFQF